MASLITASNRGIHNPTVDGATFEAAYEEGRLFYGRTIRTVENCDFTTRIAGWEQHSRCYNCINAIVQYVIKRCEKVLLRVSRNHFLGKTFEEKARIIENKGVNYLLDLIKYEESDDEPIDKLLDRLLRNKHTHQAIADSIIRIFNNDIDSFYKLAVRFPLCHETHILHSFPLITGLSKTGFVTENTPLIKTTRQAIVSPFLFRKISEETRSNTNACFAESLLANISHTHTDEELFILSILACIIWMEEFRNPSTFIQIFLISTSNAGIDISAKQKGAEVKISEKRTEIMQKMMNLTKENPQHKSLHNYLNMILTFFNEIQFNPRSEIDMYDNAYFNAIAEKINVEFLAELERFSCTGSLTATGTESKAEFITQKLGLTIAPDSHRDSSDEKPYIDLTKEEQERRVNFVIRDFFMEYQHI